MIIVRSYFRQQTNDSNNCHYCNQHHHNNFNNRHNEYHHHYNTHTVSPNISSLHSCCSTLHTFAPSSAGDTTEDQER